MGFVSRESQEILLFPQNDQTGSGATEPPTKLPPDFPPLGEKRRGREFNQSTSSSAGVKNKWR